METIIFIVSVVLLIFSTVFFIISLKSYLPVRKERQKKLLHKRLDHDFYFPITVIVQADDYPFSYINNVLTQDYKLFEVIMTDCSGDPEKVKRLIKHYSLKEDNQRPIRYYKDCIHPDRIYRGREGNIPLTLLVHDAVKDSVPELECPLLTAGVAASRMPYISFSKNEERKIIPGTCLKNLARCVLEDDNITEANLYGMYLYNKAKFIEELLPVSPSLHKAE
ncbi:MAG: hypothetical protein K6G87_18680 [Butyrivibrio sp.]|uniref:hypothetical protein n=1 Tax=Butyrivibrio sp. TaxID=28121 RepID=UPI0025FC8C65|nr:hypothetical protein [Butyrivibrio sp.]MCR5773252.1 hypothetical protein [Butyrivibrio sp.]